MTATPIIHTVDDLDLTALKAGETHRFYVNLSDSSLAQPWQIPVIVLRGAAPGPTLGVSAAIHGDELNGILTTFRLANRINPQKLSGTLILVPITNVPGFFLNQRCFSDDVDLNRTIPGKLNGAPSEIYANLFVKKIVKHFNYLLDLHTASYGRINSLYLRANIDDPAIRTLAYLQNPQIIVRKHGEEGNLRTWADAHDIPTVTIEIGNPNMFQHDLIEKTYDGLINTLNFLKMTDGIVTDFVSAAACCHYSYWIRATKGGIVDVLPNLCDEIHAGQTLAYVYDHFGHIKEEINAPERGIVIGKNILPNCDAGTEVLHLGVQRMQADPKDIPGHQKFSNNSVD